MAKPRSGASIRSLPFRHNRKAGLGFEIFKLSALYERADRRILGHALETPQRPEFHTIYVGLRGEGELIVDFTSVPIGDGYLTFVARGRVQQFVPDRSVDAWMLVFAPEFLEIPGTGDPLVMPSVLWPLQTVPSLQLDPFTHHEVITLAEQLDVEHEREADVYQPWILTSLLRALILHAERISAWQAPVSSLGRFFTILERDHATTRSVTHYARESGISVRRLAEILVAETGRTTKEVIDDRVVLEQKRLLAHTGITVKELAARTGFDEPTNLVKFFKHHTGQTPLEFRADVSRPRRRISPSRRRS
jgi:AraC family transcriptional activator of pobA